MEGWKVGIMEIKSGEDEFHFMALLTLNPFFQYSNTSVFQYPIIPK
jgi:hypothetical protein